MRVIVPILIAAIWTSATIRINGVWPPAELVESIVRVGERVEAPARALLARLEGDPAMGPLSEPASQRAERKNQGLGPRPIALPGLPKGRRESVCS